MSSDFPISFAIIPPKFEACCPCTPIFKSESIASFTAYVPPSMDFRSPPLPTMASKVFISKFFSLSTFNITSFLKLNCSNIPSKLLISSDECLKVSTKTSFSSSYTPILVEVEPGLIINNLYDILFLLYVVRLL